MISLSVAWVIVTAIKQPDIKGFEINPLIFLFTGMLDCLMVGILGVAFGNAC